MKEMASTMNFSTAKGDLMIKICRLEYIPCCTCDLTASEGMTMSLFAYNLFLKAKVKSSPKILCC